MVTRGRPKTVETFKDETTLREARSKKAAHVETLTTEVAALAEETDQIAKSGFDQIKSGRLELYERNLEAKRRALAGRARPDLEQLHPGNTGGDDAAGSPVHSTFDSGGVDAGSVAARLAKASVASPGAVAVLAAHRERAEAIRMKSFATTKPLSKEQAAAIDLRDHPGIHGLVAEAQRAELFQRADFLAKAEEPEHTFTHDLVVEQARELAKQTGLTEAQAVRLIYKTEPHFYALHGAELRGRRRPA